MEEPLLAGCTCFFVLRFLTCFIKAEGKKEGKKKRKKKKRDCLLWKINHKQL